MAQILVGEGEVVPVGTVLVAIADGAGPTAAADDQPRAEPAPQQAVVAESDLFATESPKQRPCSTRPRHATRPPAGAGARVDLAALAATGPQGRVTEHDVRAAVGDTALHRVTGVETQPRPEDRRERLRGMRRVIAENMTRAQREVPPVTWVEECDFTGVALDRLVPTVLRACALALREFPELNARLEGDEIVYLDHYDLGFAIPGPARPRRPGDPRLRPAARPTSSTTQATRLADAARAGWLEAGRAARLDLHGHERRQARRALRDAV